MSDLKRARSEEKLTIFIVTLDTQNEYHDHEVLDVFRAKREAMHSILMSDEMKELCDELGEEDQLMMDYHSYIASEHTPEFIAAECSKLYETLIDHLYEGKSIEDCHYWFGIAERIVK